VRVPFVSLLVITLVACTPAPDATLQVVAVAGPTCPVVSDPADPACADRPVEGAQLVVLGEDGEEIARAMTDADGRASIGLPAGRFTVVPQPAQGLMGTAPPAEILIVPGDDPERLVVAYDTGIR
jgi:hypothetical protein